MLKKDKIAKCLAQINIIDDYKLELIYNIFGEAQYLLIESTNEAKKAYIIYDFMLEEAIEYNENKISDWSLNENAVNSIKIYLNLTEKLYIFNDGLYNVFTDELISEIYGLEDMINFTDCALNPSVEMSEIDIERYNNRLVKDEYNIKNSFFFENFFIDEELDFNSQGSCVIVATSLLLSYYDVFYNDNIIDDEVYYNGTTYLTSNNIAHDIFANDDTSDSTNYNIKYTDRFYIDTWGNTKYKKTGACEFDDLEGVQWYNFAGPTKEFHDYLVEIAEDNGYFAPWDGMFVFNAKYLLDDYFEMKNFEGVSTYTNFDDSNIINCLNNDIPVIIGATGYDYYNKCYLKYDNESIIKGVNNSLQCSHSVIAYGYQKTSIGTFYHVNMGWANYFLEIDGVDYYNNYSDAYISPYLMGFHTYIDASNLNHVCSNQYQLYDKNIDLVIPVCPCQTLNNNMNFVQYDDYFDYVDINNDNLYDIQFSHKFDDYNLYNDEFHLIKCRLYDECGQYKIEEHDFSLIGKYNEERHYIKCRDCGYIKYESHLYKDEEPNGIATHSQYCSICYDYYGTENHTFIYRGDDSSHIGICADCQYEQNIDNHEIQLTQHSERNHKFYCSCGYERYEEHFYNEELICTICSYAHNLHSYNYSQYTNKKHLKTCACGVEEYETHSYVSDGIITRCRYCGYRTNGNVAINGNLVNDEILFVNNLYYYEEGNRDEE